MTSKLLSGSLLSIVSIAAYMASPFLFTLWLWVFPTLPMGVARSAHQYGSSHWIATASVLLVWYVFSVKLLSKNSQTWKWVLAWICTSFLFIHITFLCLLLFDTRTWLTTDFQPFTSGSQMAISRTYILPWNTLLGNVGLWLMFGNRNTLHMYFDISYGLVNPLGLQVEQWLLSLVWLFLFAFLTSLCVKLFAKPILSLTHSNGTASMIKAQKAWAILLFLAYYLSKSDVAFINLSYGVNTVIDLLKSVAILLVLSSFGTLMTLGCTSFLMKTIRDT